MAWQRPEFCPLDQSQLSLNTELPLHLFPFRVLKLSAGESTRARAPPRGTREQRNTAEGESRRRTLRGTTAANFHFSTVNPSFGNKLDQPTPCRRAIASARARHSLLEFPRTFLWKKRLDGERNEIC